MSEAKNILESFRDVVQDLLVPELKALQVTVEALRTDMKHGDEKPEQAMKLRDEKLEQMIRLGNEKTEAAIRPLADSFESAIHVRERLAAIEARLPHQ